MLIVAVDPTTWFPTKANATTITTMMMNAMTIPATIVPTEVPFG
jgi:hypothetical protein